MTTFSHISDAMVRTVLEAGRPSAYYDDLSSAIDNTYEAWDEDQHNEDLDHRAYEARCQAIEALDDLMVSVNSDIGTVQAGWDALLKYWTN